MASGFYDIGTQDPGRRALVELDRVSTYGELLGTVDRMSNGMVALGLAPGDTLALVSGNRRETLEVYAAAVQVGLYVVPVNWHLAAHEIEYLLVNSRAAAIVVEDRFGDTGRTAADAADLPAGMRFSIGAAPGFRPLTELADGQPATPPHDRQVGQAMFYTSGTTGRPKGVRKTVLGSSPADVSLCAGIGIRRATAGDLPPQEDARVAIVPGPLYHAAPLAAAAAALDEGACLVLMDRFDPERFLDLVARHRVTTATMVPTMFHRLLSLPDDVRTAADVSSLRAVSHAGAPCPVDVKHRMIEWFGPILTEGYSSTEGAGTSVTSEEWLERPGTVGRPSPGVTLSILDDEGRPCPTGTPGRVFLSQALWQFEYLGDPDKTEAARRDGLFTVGDIGYVDSDGYLFLCDRDSEVILSGGVNIYPAEVESILLTHPALDDAVVIGVPNDEWGEEVRAVAQLRRGLEPSPQLESDVIEYCRERAAHYKCPRAVDFVTSLERDPNGKVRKGPIRERYWQGRSRAI